MKDDLDCSRGVEQAVAVAAAAEAVSAEAAAACSRGALLLVGKHTGA